MLRRLSFRSCKDPTRSHETAHLYAAVFLTSIFIDLLTGSDDFLLVPARAILLLIPPDEFFIFGENCHDSCSQGGGVIFTELASASCIGGSALCNTIVSCKSQMIGFRIEIRWFKLLTGMISSILRRYRWRSRGPQNSRGVLPVPKYRSWEVVGSPVCSDPLSNSRSRDI